MKHGKVMVRNKKKPLWVRTSQTHQYVIKFMNTGNMTVTVFEYLFFNFHIIFTILSSPFLLSFSCVWEDLTLRILFDYIAKDLETRQRYSGTSLNSNFFIRVWKCAQAQSFVSILLPVTGMWQCMPVTRFPYRVSTQENSSIPEDSASN